MEFLTHPEAQAFLVAIRSDEAEDTPGWSSPTGSTNEKTL